MCGIVGYITTKDDGHPTARQHFLYYGLAMDTLRGADSTGLIGVDKDFRVRTVKSILPGTEFIHSRLYHSGPRDGWATIGHNRAATLGSVKVRNAHPFKFGPITGVHNGTLWRKGQEMPFFDEAMEVDSMLIFNALSKVEPEQAIPEVLEKIDGSYALVWTDDRDKSINFARNKDRPMHLAFNNSRDFMMFMSDGQMLASLNKSLTRNVAHATTIYSLDANLHLKFYKGSLEPEVSKFRPFAFQPVYHNRTYTPQERLWTAPSGPHGKDSKSGGQNSGKTAVEKAVSLWSRNVSAYHDRKSGKSTISEGGTSTKERTVCMPTTTTNGSIPTGHEKLIKRFFELTPGQEMQFIPESATHYGNNGKCMVRGTVVHPGWGDTPWDAVMLDVYRVTYNSFKDVHWSGKLVGVFHPVAQTGNDIPALRLEYNHGDWARYERNKDIKDTVTIPCSKSDVVVVDEDFDEYGDSYEPVPYECFYGPSGKIVDRHELERELEKGCICCGGNLDMDEVTEYEYVNNEQDIVCVDCKWNYMGGESV